MEAVTDFIILNTRFTADGDCSHEIKRFLLLWRKAMTNLHSILKSRDITLLTKASIVKSCGFSNSHVLECEIKWALGSITMNKASRDDKNSSWAISNPKMMLLKHCTQYVTKFGKLSHGHRTGKGQFSFQSQRRAMPKNVQTTAQLSSFYMLGRQCSKSFKLGFNSKWTENFQMHKLDLEEAEEP